MSRYVLTIVEDRWSVRAWLRELPCAVQQDRCIFPVQPPKTVQIWGMPKVHDSCLLACRTKFPFLETKAREQEGENNTHAATTQTELWYMHGTPCAQKFRRTHSKHPLFQYIVLESQVFRAIKCFKIEMGAITSCNEQESLADKTYSGICKLGASILLQLTGIISLKMLKASV